MIILEKKPDCAARIFMSDGEAGHHVVLVHGEEDKVSFDEAAQNYDIPVVCHASNRDDNLNVTHIPSPV